MLKISDAWRRTKYLLIAAAGMPAFSLVGIAQGAAAPAATGAEIAAAATKPLEWEVISVKPAEGCTMATGMKVNQDGLQVICLPLRSLVQIAWSINETSRVLGAPAWATETMYNIEAKVAGEDVAAFSRLEAGPRNQMLQALLEQRFNLRTHLETRDLPVYDLVVAKSGAKLKEAAPDEVAKPMLWMRNRGEIDSSSMPLHSVLYMLSRELDRPVVDKTGLAGKYDFALKFSPAMSAASDSQDPSIFTAIQEQLGLKLEPSKAPLPVVVIDSVQKPTKN
jgi:uncharacterized protein (TIGR03435 family)